MLSKSYSVYTLSYTEIRVRTTSLVLCFLFRTLLFQLHILMFVNKMTPGTTLVFCVVCNIQTLFKWNYWSSILFCCSHEDQYDVCSNKFCAA